MSDWADEIVETIIPDRSDRAFYHQEIAQALRDTAMTSAALASTQARAEGYASGYLDAANEIAEPYPPDLAMFAPLTDDQIKAAVAAMGGDISGRLHAHWARHWSKVLRRRAEEQLNER